MLFGFRVIFFVNKHIIIINNINKSQSKNIAILNMHIHPNDWRAKLDSVHYCRPIPQVEFCESVPKSCEF